MTTDTSFAGFEIHFDVRKNLGGRCVCVLS